MARPLRIEQAGCWYHVTARGNERRDIFRDDTDRRHFVELLGQAVSMFALRLHAYVLMPNHYHLLVELTDPNLSRSIHWLNVSYTVWFNRRHARSGHLLQGRFKSVAVEPEGWGLELSRYIHLNPARTGRHGLGKRDTQRSRSVGLETVNPEQVRQRIAEVRSHRWGSYRCYVGTLKSPPWLTTTTVLNLAGSGAGPDWYREYCEEALRQGPPESPWTRVIGQTVLGSERFAARLAAGLKKDAPATKRLSKRPDFNSVIAVVENLRGQKWGEFRDSYGDWGRDLALHLGRKVCGMSIRELSARVQIEYMSAATALRRFAEKAQKDATLAKQIDRAIKQMQNE